MTKRAGLRAVPLTAVAVAGVLLGHWLAYLAALPNGSLRGATLAETGHGYWTEAVRLAVALGVSGVAALVLVHLRRDPGVPAPATGVSWLVLRLALVQSLAFLVIETVERVAVHAPVSSVLEARVLVLGLAFQVLTACLGAVLMRSLDRAVAELVRRLRRPAVRARAVPRSRIFVAPPLRRSVLAGASGVRGPPPVR